MNEEYSLYYWGAIQGRGEFPRLIFEEAGVPYNDVGRGRDGQARVRAMREDAGPFAPPILQVGTLVLGQTAVICDALAERFDLVPTNKRRTAMQHQLSIADAVVEAHDTHHPLGAMLHYEEQIEAAKQRARSYREHRLPKWLRYFDQQIDNAGGAWLLGDVFSYVDLSLFQLVEGLRFAFPRAMHTYERSAPQVVRAHAAVRERPRIAAYLRSNRRIPFNNHGLFRHYPELDQP